MRLGQFVLLTISAYALFVEVSGETGVLEKNLPPLPPCTPQFTYVPIMSSTFVW
jgi:hypothetical protein